MARSALVAIATLRDDAALEYLLGLVASAPEPTALDALTALSIHRGDDRLREHVARAAEGRVELAQAVRDAFA